MTRSATLRACRMPSAPVSTGLYNANGFRTQWSDADAGAWSYTPNSLNELVAWSDAKGQSFGATYDAAGRMTTRTEPEGTSTWSWGTRRRQETSVG